MTCRIRFRRKSFGRIMVKKGLMDMSNTLEKYAFENYYFGNKATCREERQYALFLYNVFLKKLYFDRTENKQYELTDKETKILAACLSQDCIANIEIVNVFYEFSALRDNFAAATNKEEFNEALIKGVFPNEADAKAVINSLSKFNNKANSKSSALADHLGKLNMEFFENQEQLKIEQLKILYLIRCMMNAKADIVVLFKENNEYRVRALECKFKSGESKYKALHELYAEVNPLTQTEVQKDVLKYLFKGIEVDGKIINIEVDNSIIKFTQKAKTDEATKNTVEININVFNDL